MVHDEEIPLPLVLSWSCGMSCSGTETGMGAARVKKASIAEGVGWVVGVVRWKGCSTTLLC